MNNLGQTQAFFVSKRQLAPYHGHTQRPVGMLFVDGPSGNKRKMPRDGTEFSYIGAGIPVPHLFLPMTQASGAAVCPLSGASFAATPGTGSLTFNQSITGYTYSFAGMSSANGQGWQSPLETAWEPAVPMFFIFDFQLTSTGGNRTILTLGSNAIIQFNSLGQMMIAVSGATTVTGTFDYRNVNVKHEIAGIWDPTGPSPVCILRTTGNETLTMNALPFVGDSAKGIGSVNAGISSPVSKVGMFAAWFGSVGLDMANRGGTRQGAAQMIADRAAA